MTVTGHAREPLELLVSLVRGADPLATLGVLWQGPPDAQMRVEGNVVERASRYATGAATLRLVVNRDHVVAQAWGPGAREALDTVPALVGERDDPSPLVRACTKLSPRRAGACPACDSRAARRCTRRCSSRSWARRSRHSRRVAQFGALIRRFGEPAPGPSRLMVPPPPEKLARTPYWAFHALGYRASSSGHHPGGGGRRAPVSRASRRCRPRTGSRASASLPGIGAVDRGRGDPAVVRRSGRGQRRRLPPAHACLLRRSPASATGRTSGCSSCSSRTPGNVRASCC